MGGVGGPVLKDGGFLRSDDGGGGFDRGIGGEERDSPVLISVLGDGNGALEMTPK